MNEIILKPKIGLNLVFHVLGFCILLGFALFAGVQADILPAIAFILLALFVGFPIPKFLTSRGQIRLTKEGIGYYSWFKNTKEFHKWNEIHSFELLSTTYRGCTHKFLRLHLKDDPWPTRILTNLQILGTSLEDLESYLNKRLE